MERIYLDRLIAWKNREDRKPLIVRGARQVGKTWLIKTFGKQEFSQMIYVNFEDEPQLKNLFQQDFDITRIINTLEIFSGLKITPYKTLIVFDEVQEAQRGITSLKYFCEKAKEYFVIAAGSLLGLSLHEQDSFPVGKVHFLDIYPLNFNEYLVAIGQQSLLNAIQRHDWQTISIFKDKLIGYLKDYYYVGGMPEVVNSFLKKRDYAEVRRIQKEILSSYENDFSKHAPINQIPRIRMVWNGIPAQLSKENKRFVYGVLKAGARAKEFELAIEWLVNAGLIYKCFKVSKPDIPLIAYKDDAAFKLYSLDIGLLGAMSGLDVKVIINGDALFEEFKGALAEQYVFNQLQTLDNIVLAYWTNERNTAEVDFILQYNNMIVPVEVKAAENLQAKSFRAFCQKYKPQKAVRTSLSNYRKEEWFENIPLYGILEIRNSQL